MNILCIIPARSGSKGIKHKNINCYESPLNIEQAKKANTRIIKPDSEEYQKIAIKYGAEAPFLRPSEISQDLSTDIELIEHCLDYLEKEEEYVPDFIVQLRPTYPTRKVKILDETIKLFIEQREKGIDSLRTVIPIEKSPFKMYTLEIV